MAEARYKEVVPTRSVLSREGLDGDERRERLHSRGHAPVEASDLDLELDDSGVELDDDGDERTRVDRPAASYRTSGVVPRNRDTGALPVGAMVAGKYRIEHLIEETDTFAIVQAFHLGLEQVVTLKYLLPSASARSDTVARFLRDARTASQLQSEHVARIIDVGRTRSRVPFVVTEELSGWELDEVLRVRGPLPVQEAVEYVIQATEAVAEGHALGIIHGGLNLGNLVLTRRPDDSPLVKVLGFGASALPERRLLGGDGASLLGASGFTSVLPYLAPEQIRLSDTLDERADVWALGALLHTLLTGSPPFRGKTAVELLAVVSADPPRRLSEVRDDISSELEACVLRCLEKDRVARFSNLAELAVALKPFAPGDALPSIERISRMFGRGTRPPPLPGGRNPNSIVPVSRPPAAPAAAAAPPVPAASRWFLLAAAAGAGAGVLGALLVALTIRSEIGALVKANAGPVAVSGATQAAPPAVQQPLAVAALTPPPAAPLAAAPVAPAAKAPSQPIAVSPPATPVVASLRVPPTVGRAEPATPHVPSPQAASRPASPAHTETAAKPAESPPAADLFADTK